MAIIDGLTTLAAVKLEAGISDTSQDTLLEALINSASAAIRAYTGRELTRTTHTDEIYAVNNHQYLYLNEYPVQSVTSVTLGGVAQVAGTDYFLGPQDMAAGRLYRPLGWTGNMYSRGTFPDVYSGARDIKATYIAGWYLPADALYVAGAAASLPLALTYACTRAVVSRFLNVSRGADGLESLGEGGLSYSWFGPGSFRAGGFDDIVTGMLLPFKRCEAA